jgi:hypothetical protein
MELRPSVKVLSMCARAQAGYPAGPPPPAPYGGYPAGAGSAPYFAPGARLRAPCRHAV